MACVCVELRTQKNRRGFVPSAVAAELRGPEPGKGRACSRHRYIDGPVDVQNDRPLSQPWGQSATKKAVNNEASVRHPRFDGRWVLFAGQVITIDGDDDLG